MNFSKRIQVKPLPPHKKGEEVMRVHVIYASAVSPAAPDRGPRQSWDLEVTSPASFHEVSQTIGLGFPSNIGNNSLHSTKPLFKLFLFNSNQVRG